jgi:hypothetical protein
MPRIAVADTAAEPNHYVKPGQVALPSTKCFSHQAFHPVAIYGQSLDFTRDNQSQSEVRKIIGFSENLEKFAACRTPESNNGGELFCFAQAMSFWKVNRETPQ